MKRIDVYNKFYHYNNHLLNNSNIIHKKVANNVRIKGYVK